MTGTRWRLVEQQNGGREHVHSVVLTEAEARDFLTVEENMHRRAGWTTTLGQNDDGDPDVLVCRRTHPRTGQPVERVLHVREYDPMTDKEVTR